MLFNSRTLGPTSGQLDPPEDRIVVSLAFHMAQYILYVSDWIPPLVLP